MASSDCCTAIRLVYFIDDATLSVEPTPEMTNYQYTPRSYTSETIGQVHLPRDWKSAPPNSPSTQYLPRRKYGESWTHICGGLSKIPSMSCSKSLVLCLRNYSIPNPSNCRRRKMLELGPWSVNDGKWGFQVSLAFKFSAGVCPICLAYFVLSTSFNGCFLHNLECPTEL